MASNPREGVQWGRRASTGNASLRHTPAESLGSSRHLSRAATTLGGGGGAASAVPAGRASALDDDDDDDDDDDGGGNGGVAQGEGVEEAGRQGDEGETGSAAPESTSARSSGQCVITDATSVAAVSGAHRTCTSRLSGDGNRLATRATVSVETRATENRAGRNAMALRRGQDTCRPMLPPSPPPPQKAAKIARSTVASHMLVM